MKKQNLNSNTIRPAEKNIGKNLCVYAAGMCAGIAIAMIAMLFFLRYHLIQTYSCGNLSFDEVEKAVIEDIGERKTEHVAGHIGNARNKGKREHQQKQCADDIGKRGIEIGLYFLFIECKHQASSFSLAS